MNATQIMKIPKSNQTTIHCNFCDADLPIYIVSDSLPHLYCTKCNNVYHERHEEDYFKRFRLTPYRRKIMRHIEGHAPHCECNGLFLFNAIPRCLKCHHHLSVKFKPDSKKRLFYKDMMVFDGTKEYVDQGKTRIYNLEN